MEVFGEGTTVPDVGQHTVQKNALVDLQAVPAPDWDFYAWTGPDAADVTEPFEPETTILADSDKHIIAFFAQEYVDVQFEAQHFQGSRGTIKDLTNRGPYPPGFKVHLRAEPESEDDEFLHWSVEFVDPVSASVTSASVDPRDFFDNYESQETYFEVPGQRVIVRAFFTKRTPPIQTGKFDYDSTDFGKVITGEYGITDHCWDISSLKAGEQIDFYFHARTIPDRFTVYCGDWDGVQNSPDNHEVFASGWVSAYPTYWENPAIYPEGIRLHDWDSRVEETYWDNPWQAGPGGVFRQIVTKQDGQDVLWIRVEGRDEGTIWDYKVVRSQ